MGLILLVLLLALIFAGIGFAIHVLWVIAIILWIIGFTVGRGASAGSHRWYRW
jgi:hypothetical protein